MKTQFTFGKLAPLFLAIYSIISVFNSIITANEISFAEKFALADDRNQVLKTLIPGTSDYYYYHTLHALNENRLPDAAAHMETWLARHGQTAELKEMQNRHALLLYNVDQQASLDYLKKELNLQFTHTQKILGAKPDLPTQVKPEQLSWDAFLQQAFQDSNNLEHLSDKGLSTLLHKGTNLDSTRLKHLLSRIKRPDHERLVGLIAADLRHRTSKGFGEYPIHLRLLPNQLDELLQLSPDLITKTNFVQTRLRKFLPGAEVDWRNNPEEKQKVLTEMWNFSRPLAASFNSLKAHILYQLLDLHQRSGAYPRDLFLEYIKIPRALPYMDQNYLNHPERRSYHANLNNNFLEITNCLPIQNDEDLVRNYFLEYFREDNDFHGFSNYIKEDYLKLLFAEAKLTSGVGDPEKWYSLMDPASIDSLNKRVDIQLLPTNKENFLKDEPVFLDVALKNVPKLLVKVYELNAFNYYKDHKNEIDTDIKLDGLTPNFSKSYTFERAPILRSNERIAIPSLNEKQGVFVIELIGNGLSSRALIRKGQLQYLSQTTAAGELVTVIDSENNPVKDPVVWFGGREYRPHGAGEPILLPFSDQGRQKIILSDGQIYSLEDLDFPIEQYNLSAGFFVNRESILPGRTADILVRPSLTLRENPVPLELLTDTKLEVTTVDSEDIRSTFTIENFQMHQDKESVFPFLVPNNLISLDLSLSGVIKPISGPGKKITLRSSEEFQYNEIHLSEAISDLHLREGQNKYSISLLGKSGEPVPNRSVSVSFYHSDFQISIDLDLRTDEEGSITFPKIEEIEYVYAETEGVPEREWELQNNYHSIAGQIHSIEGEPVILPAPDLKRPFERKDLSIIEVNQSIFLEDHFQKASFKEGAIWIEGLEPGDYDVHLGSSGHKARLKVTGASNHKAGYALSSKRHLQIINSKPLYIRDCSVGEKELVIKLANASKSSRVHLIATEFYPHSPDLANLHHRERADPVETFVYKIPSLYVSSRDIGDEYRYILERRSARTFPGNRLPRPGLLLNPWEVSNTQTEVKVAKKGGDYQPSGAVSKPQTNQPQTRRSSFPAKSPISDVAGNTASFDFLSQPGVVVYNQSANAEGTVRISRELFANKQFLQVIATDGDNSAIEFLSIPEAEQRDLFSDLRLSEPLAPDKHFITRRNTSVLKSGDTLSVQDYRASQIEKYDTLTSVYMLLAGISENPTLKEFQFILTWHNLPDKEKARLYSEYACHELHFFISRHDPEFFQKNIFPFLKNKTNKTFLDDYLVNNDLTKYNQPWHFSRLNTAERALLARRLGGEDLLHVRKQVSAILDLQPINIEEQSYLYQSALRGFQRIGQTPQGGGGAMIVAQEGAMQGDVADAFGFSGDEATTPAVVAGAPVQAEMESLEAPAAGRRGRIAMTGKKIKALRTRAAAQKLYEPLETTKEWAENNYYRLPANQQNSDLIRPNRFWEDYLNWNGEGVFLSPHFTTTASSFSEMMIALSILEFPMERGKHETSLEKNQYTFNCKSPTIVFHEEVEEARKAVGNTSILVTQNFFRNDDRYIMEQGVQRDRFLSDEFLTGILYGAQIVITNPESIPHKVDLLLQIPEGAVPANGSRYTKNLPLLLQPFGTRKVEYFFYFPKPSEDEGFQHFPVHVTKGNEILTWDEPFRFQVSEEPRNSDKDSWPYLSQIATDDEVLEWLASNNARSVDLAQIAWRARERKDFFQKLISLLMKQRLFNETIWSYGIHYNDRNTIRDYLLYQERFLKNCGRHLTSPLVSIEPVERHWYQHLEYSPLVNARTHRLGSGRSILNNSFQRQYEEFAKILCYHNELQDQDILEICYYLFLQDRIEEGLSWLERIENPGNVDARIQLDYLDAYASLYREDLQVANELAAKYKDYPIKHWQNRFALVQEHAGLLQGGSDGDHSESNRDRNIENLSDSAPRMDLEIADNQIELRYQNIEDVRIHFYEMDLEFLFSSNPFVSARSGQFGYIRPNLTDNRQLDSEKDSISLPIPNLFQKKNVLVEVAGAGRSSAKAVYANSFDLHVNDGYGLLEVNESSTKSPIRKAYIKVYAKFKNGEVSFYKDGYTDIRGKFDYASLSTDQLNQVERFSILVMTEDHGSAVRETDPPQS